MPKLFGTNGVRGNAETLFTKEFCVKLGAVFGKWLKEKNKEGFVAVAIDPRDSSPRIKDYVCQGLAAQGWEILDEGVVPTPALTYFVNHTPQVGGGIMITGSHVTADLNGVKFLIDGQEVSKEQELEIEDLFSSFTDEVPLVLPTVIFESKARDMYIAMLTKLAHLPYPAWKIGVDTANGTQTEIVRDLFVNLGLEMECVGECNIQSANFVPRDTEAQHSMVDLIREVASQKLDLGVAFDVDGDRVVFVDDLGRFVPGDYSCALIAQDDPCESVVTTINTSSVVDEIGKKVYRTPVGATRVIAKMQEVGATFGFEANGGGISSEIVYGRDGGSTLIKLLNLLKKEGKPLSVLYNDLPEYHLFRDKVDCPVQDYAKVYAQVKLKYQGKRLEEIDGVKIWLSDSEWLLFRGSGNAPEFRVFTQSKDAKRVQKLGAEGIDFVKQTVHTKVRSQLKFTDSLHILETIQHFPKQCDQAIAEAASIDIPSDYNFATKIVLAGMGGSALGGRIAVSLERAQLKVPFFVSTEFHLPEFVDEDTLVIVSSYSGNTEETLSCLQEAIAKKAKIIGLTTGGKLADKLRTSKLPMMHITPRHNPSGQPRMGVGYSTMAVLALLARCQLLKAVTNVSNLGAFLHNSQKLLESSTLELAKTIVEKIPVLFAGEHLKGATHATKNMLNENAKSFSVMFDLPEADHHLLEGLVFPFDDVRDLAFIFIESDKYHPELQKRFALTSQVFARQDIPVVHIKAQGESELFEAMWLIQWGMYLSYYLAREYKIDPGPIPWVNYLKDQLKS